MEMASTSTTSFPIRTTTRRYFLLCDGVSVLLPDDEDESELLVLTVEPLDTSCPPLSESVPEGPSLLLSLLLLLLLLLLLRLLLLLLLLLLPCATGWCSMSPSTMGISINLAFRARRTRCSVASTSGP